MPTQIDSDILIRAAIQEARSSAAIERKEAIGLWLDYWDRQGLKHLKAKPAEKAQSFANRPKIAWGIVPDIISRISRVYDRPPRREILPNPRIPAGALAELERIYSDELTQSIDQDTDALTRLCGVTAQRYYWNPDTQQIEIHPFLPDDIDPIQDPDNPMATAALALTVSLPSTVQGIFSGVVTRLLGRHQPMQRTVVYTADKIRIVEDGKDRPGMDDGTDVNPYGVIPVTIYRDSFPWRDWWATGLGQSLIPAAQAIDRAWTDLLYLLEMQSFSIPVYENCKPADTKTSVGAGSPLITLLPPGATRGGFRFETPNPNIAGMLATFNATMDMAYQTHFLSQSPLRMTVVPSGIALALQRVDLLDDWQRRQSRWLGFERDRAYKIIAVWCAHNGHAIPRREDVVLNIDWSPPRIPIDTDVQIRDQAFRLSNDIAAAWELRQERNPDLTEDEAKEQVEAAAAYNAQWRGKRNAGGAVDQLSAAIGSFQQLQAEEAPAQEVDL